MNIDNNNYPELFFERFLREPNRPRQSFVSVLGTRSIRVSNEAFKAALVESLKTSGLVSEGEAIDLEFSYLDFSHTLHEALNKQKSIHGKGGFTITLRVGSVFITEVFLPAMDGNVECYRHAQHPFHVVFTTSDIETADTVSVHGALIGLLNFKVEETINYLKETHET